MAKKMDIEHNDVKYVLEYTRKSVEMMERQGFEIEELQRKPMTYLPPCCWRFFGASPLCKA